MICEVAAINPAASSADRITSKYLRMYFSLLFPDCFRF
ncbi:hypothetical protein CSIRO_0395 [Bradyrhizobiaceae bacterium SG-6C]|nr:hypothetical protein CSIRO_0395 [Bradyrhizobiaceae bacterium SG-6C]